VKKGERGKVTKKGKKERKKKEKRKRKKREGREKKKKKETETAGCGIKGGTAQVFGACEANVDAKARGEENFPLLYFSCSPCRTKTYTLLSFFIV
jgi:hypothetical protein